MAESAELGAARGATRYMESAQSFPELTSAIRDANMLSLVAGEDSAIAQNRRYGFGHDGLCLRRLAEVSDKHAGVDGEEWLRTAGAQERTSREIASVASLIFASAWGPPAMAASTTQWLM